MKLPNAENAVVEIEKLVDYCLNPAHPRGKHKARVFAAACGIVAENAEIIHLQLLEAAMENEAIPLLQDTHGARYVIEFVLEGPLSRARVRSAWIIRNGEDFPRFVSAFVL